MNFQEFMSDEEIEDMEDWERYQEAGEHSYREFIRAKDHEDECGDR